MADTQARKVRLARCLTWLLAAALLVNLNRQAGLAAVELVSFTVSAGDGQVRVNWETASEQDIAGFYVQRSTNQNDGFTRISELIVAANEFGAFYEYIDTNVVNGTRYWYKLEALDPGGVNPEFFGPIWAVPGEPTPTATLTIPATPSSSPTQTATGGPTTTLTPTTATTQGVTPTTTRTQAPPTSSAGTAYPAPTVVQQQPTLAQPTLPPQPTKDELTPLASPSPVVTGVMTATATLLPLPDITLTFPEGGIVLQGRGTATAAQAVARSNPNAPGWNPQGGILLISVIVLIWIILGAWFYMAFRRVE